MKAILLALSFLFPFAGSCQALLSVDKTKIRIGDQVKVTVQADLSDGREWIHPEAVWPDSIKGIEVVSGPVWNKDNPGATMATWVVACFDTGYVRIPPLRIVIQKQGQRDTIFTNDIPVNVAAVEPDSTGLKAIKDIYVQPFSLGYYKRYLPHLAVFLLVLAGLFVWLRQRKSKHTAPPSTPLPPVPHEWAFNALEELAQKKLWQRGEVKEHYTFLTAILREYLERRYSIHALEQTSDEILAQLQLKQLPHDVLLDTSELLSVADLIKFAKADPGIDIHAAAIERVRSFVKETIPSYTQGNVEPQKMAGDESVE